jgi:hypothetical protein
MRPIADGSPGLGTQANMSVAQQRRLRPTLAAVLTAAAGDRTTRSTALLVFADSEVGRGLRGQIRVHRLGELRG